MSSHNLLVLSDVHLGSDLVHCVRPDAPHRTGSDDARDMELSALFDWYREHPHAGRPWRLVIAGDFVDFVGMSVSAPASAISTPLDPEELALGLGGAEDHTIYKLRCVAARHRRVFRSLAEFVAAQNEIVVVRGNHDVDFHWRRVQDEFLRQLRAHAAFDERRVTFSPWFYYEEGLVFVEHGHQYDRYCSYEHLLTPLSPKDPRRSSRSLSDILLRHVVRPTRGLLETGHEDAGVIDYITFGLRLGLGGALDLATRFFQAVWKLLMTWRGHFGDGARRLRAEHEQRMTELAALLNLKLDSLRALASLQRPPVTRSLGPLLLAVMLDRVLLGLLCFVFSALAFVLMPHIRPALILTAVAMIAVTAVCALFSRFRPIDPTRELRERAALVGGLFPAAFIVMGHTHFPEVRTAAGTDSTYVNLGAWAEGEAAQDRPAVAASRTHLVLCVEEDGRPKGELLVWDAVTGPRRFICASPASAASTG